METELRCQELINQGINMMKAEKYHKAKEYFEAAIQENKRNKEAYMHLGNALVNLEKFDDAIAAFEKVLLIDPNDGEAYFNVGNVYVLKDNLLKCIENYNKAEEKGFENVELYSNLAGIYRELGEITTAIRNLNKAIKVAPLRGDIRVEKAHLYIATGKYNEALETLEELQKIIPDAFEAYDLQTQIYCGLNQHDKALEIINGAVEKFEKDVVLQWIRIKVLVEMGKNDEAKQAIEAIKSAEGYETMAREVAFQESIIHSNENNLDEAAKSLESVLENEGDSVDEQVRFLLMNIYMGKKDNDKAIQQAKKLSGTQSGTLFSVSGMYYLPHLMKQQGQVEEAQKMFKELSSYLRKLSIKLPEFYEIYIYRLLTHKELGEYEKALELADYIETLYPDHFEAYAMRTLIYNEMGRTEEAEEQKAKAKALNPNLVI